MNKTKQAIEQALDADVERAVRGALDATAELELTELAFTPVFVLYDPLDTTAYTALGEELHE